MEIDEDGIINNRVHKDIKKGQLYMNKEILQDVLNHIAIKENFQFKVKRSSTTRYYLVCIDDQCSWYFKSSSLNNSNIFKAWRAKEKAIEILRGKPRDSYGKLPSYLYMVKHTNPGSVTRLEKTDDGRFLYAYLALYASIKGLEYCMPVVVVDGSFLKAAYRGTILTACTQDAAGKILPLAFAVVDSENDASWKWFFERIRETYGIREGVPHCVCLYHLWGNIRKIPGSTIRS
ncbi:hypothetical protein KY289_008426 [Solanum tuberosum]|nr:hypothetical protein KY289_008426 [Solanum tuberosum]